MIRSHTAIAVGVIVVAGGLFAWFVSTREPDAPATVSPQTSQAVTEAGQPVTGRMTNVPGQTMSSPSRTVGDDLDGEARRALDDPAYLQKLLAMYATETDLDTKGALLAVLHSAARDSEEILRFALDMADNPDPSKRGDGLALLEAYPLDNTEVRELLTRQISEESDPAMLSRLVGMLEAAVVPTEDSAPVVEQLSRLRQHPDPEVRAAGVLQSMAWDKGGDTEALLHQAILDPAPQVRQAAIGGVTASGTHSARIKDSLLEIAANPAAGDEERHAAVFALQDFPLNRTEYAIYQQASQTLASDDDGHDH